MSQNKRSLSVYEYYHSLFESVIADTNALREECYKIRYQVYCVDYDWERSRYQHSEYKLERDAYDKHSVHALLRHRKTGLFIGTVRLILHPSMATSVFPVYKLCAENGLHLPQSVPLANTAEISRFCISKELRRRVTDSERGTSYTAEELAHDRARMIPAMSLGLISMLFLMAKQNNVQQWYAEMEPFLTDLLAKLGIHFDPVGPMIEFHGKRQICHKPLDAWIDRIAKERPEIWDIVTNKGLYCSLNNMSEQINVKKVAQN